MEETGLKLTNYSDSKLVELAVKQDQRAFLVLYDRYKTGVRFYVDNFITLREEAEDVVMESFDKAFKQIATYNPEYQFSTWIYAIARNTALDHISKSGRVSSNMPMSSIDDDKAGLASIPAMGVDPESEVIRAQKYEEVVAAINGLPELYRKVAQMVLLENYQYQEIAEEMGISLNTAKTRVKRSKDRVREMLAELQEGE